MLEATVCLLIAAYNSINIGFKRMDRVRDRAQKAPLRSGFSDALSPEMNEWMSERLKTSGCDEPAVPD